jgi:hypothetical protein
VLLKFLLFDKDILFVPFSHELLEVRVSLLKVGPNRNIFSERA